MSEFFCVFTSATSSTSNHNNTQYTVDGFHHQDCRAQRGPSIRDHRCPICWDDIHPGQPAVVHGAGCERAFHERCFTEWSRFVMSARRGVTCPSCRVVLVHLPTPAGSPPSSISSQIDEPEIEDAAATGTAGVVVEVTESGGIPVAVHGHLTPEDFRLWRNSGPRRPSPPLEWQMEHYTSSPDEDSQQIGRLVRRFGLSFESLLANLHESQMDITRAMLEYPEDYGVRRQLTFGGGDARIPAQTARAAADTPDGNGPHRQCPWYDIVANPARFFRRFPHLVDEHDLLFHINDVAGLHMDDHARDLFVLLSPCVWQYKVYPVPVPWHGIRYVLVPMFPPRDRPPSLPHYTLWPQPPDT